MDGMAETNNDSPPSPLALALMRELAQVPAAHGVSIPRLGKRLGVSASALMREIAHLGDAVVGGQRGPGWVRLTQEDQRWMACLTEPGRQQCEVWHGV
jgi:hypothetical protein